MRSLLRRLRTRLPTGEPSDEQLLDCFLARRAQPEAEDAFAAIVRRHGPMVRGVCRRVLRNDADADDAFQAVFVVLLRKAESVRPRSRLGNWLYGVAVNVARRGRDGVMRRRTQELTMEPPERESGGELEQGELRAVIDQELGALPDAYRAAVVACDLEGATRTEAAGRLGWSEGTVASRLARGRALLADRLSRRGVAIPAAGLLAALGPGAADAVAVGALNFHLLNTSPSPAVEALATEAMKAMTTSKLKGVAVAVLAAVGLASAGAATVWACGGYGLIPRPSAPVSEAKPYPLQSIETTEAKPSETPAWDRAAPKDVPAFADKPGAADGAVAGTAKPALFVMTNPAKDITIVSDRHEKFVEFFRRQEVLVAVVPANVRDKLLYDPKGSNGMVFVDTASFNTDGPRAAVYGAGVKLAPVTLDGPAFRLLEMTDEKFPVVFIRDEGDKNLWHAVGFTRRSAVGFFAAKERVKPDDFAPADLLLKNDKK
jgi:RNA polymerase sigma factor (sigma-70 family)